MANKVYNEYIGDRHHIHMNATRWTTLTDFCKHLAEEGICRVEEGEKGLLLSFISADPDARMRQEQQRKREMEEKNDELRMRRMIEQQVAAAARSSRQRDGDGSSTKVREYDAQSAEPVAFSLAPATAASGGGDGGGDNRNTVPNATMKRKYDHLLSDMKSESDDDRDIAATPSRKQQKIETATNAAAATKPRSNLDLILEEERKKKEVKSRKDYWLRKDIVVKCINKKLSDGKYYKRKGNVIKVHDRYTADVQMLRSGDVLRLDQSFLETVIPREGQKVKIVNGLNRGKIATLVRVDVDNFCAQLRVDKTGEIMERVGYDDFSKLVQ